MLFIWFSLVQTLLGDTDIGSNSIANVNMDRVKSAFGGYESPPMQVLNKYDNVGIIQQLEKYAFYEGAKHAVCVIFIFFFRELKNVCIQMYTGLLQKQ